MADTNVAAAVAAVAAPEAVPETTVTTTQPSAESKAQEAFARKERQIRKMQQELQTERQSWKTKLAEYETGYVPKSRLKEDPWSVLSEAGVDYNTLTEQILNQPNMNDPATKAMLAKIKALEDKQNAAEKASADANTQQYQQALKQIGLEAKMLVDSDPEYETIKAMGMYDAVTELIEKDFNDTGILKDVSEAAKEVEAYLVEEGYKMAQLSKIQSRLKPKTEEQKSPVTSKVQSKQVQITPRTLTNDMQTSPTGRSGEKERIARAMAAFHGKQN